jgi:hypothetical protein
LGIGFFLLGSVLGWHPSFASRLYRGEQSPAQAP